MKPGRASPYVPPPEGHALHLVRATLDASAADGARCVLRVQMDGGTALVVASLRAGVHESVALDLLLEEYAEFTITGDASVHLIGNLVAQHPMDESDESEEEDEEYVPTPEEMQMMVDGGWMGLPESDEEEEESDEEDGWAHQRSNVVIEELAEEVPLPSKDDANRSGSKVVEVMEKKQKKKAKTKRSKADEKGEDAIAQGSRPSKRPQESEKEEVDGSASKERESKRGRQAPADGSDKQAAKKKEKKQKKAAVEEDSPKAGPVHGSKNVRRYENGFEIVELQMGQPDGKLAQPGKKVEMRYVGKLKTNGRVFDQTKGKSTFKFRLGVGEVIKGWDVGVQGMRVGDKRRLTIPPQMAYGSSGVKGAIPPNATLTFDVELVHVW